MYPKKELPFFILFTAGLCSFTALLALLTHQYPEPMGYIAKTVRVYLLHFTALLALLTHQYPEPMGYIAKTVRVYLLHFTTLLALLTHQYPEPMGYIAKTVSNPSAPHYLQY